ncbi:MAG: hypothetical protein AB1758_05465 [Candidatus Eremiobacterota bacterium]
MSLPEVLVGMGLLSLIMLVTVGIYSAGTRAQRKADAHTATYRAAMVALEHVRSELRGGQLLTPALLGLGPQPAASYRYARVQGGLPLVDDQGVPLWAGTATLRVRSDGRLVKEDRRGTVRVLSDLGRGGSVTFERVDLQLLRLKIVAERKEGDASRDSVYRVTADLELPNN